MLAFTAIFAACSEEKDAPKPTPDKPTTTLEEATVINVPLDGEANDQGPGKINGIVSGALPAEDRHGNSNGALHFDGINDYVDLGTTIKTDSISTISVWAKFDSLSADMRDMELVSKSSYRQGMEIVIYKGKLQFYLVGVDDNNNIGVQVTSLETNKWYHIVAIYDRTAAKMEFYLDDKLIASDNAPVSITKIDPLMLGNWDYQETRYFAGYLDDLKLFNRPVTKAEVDSLYNE